MPHDDLICPNCGRVGYLTEANGELVCKWCGEVADEADVIKINEGADHV